MLSHGTSTLDLILWHLTRYYYTWHPYYMAYYDYHFYKDLHDYYTVTRPLVLLNPCTPELMYPLYSCPLHCYSSVRQSMPGVGMTRMYHTIVLASDGSWMELSATRNKVSHHTRSEGRLLNPWGPILESIPHTEQSAIHVVGATSWICGGHLLNL